jgi:hypothetical protein
VKIRGRFIGILAVLGLLIALVPLAPAGAVAGSVTLKGGADNNGLFYSDKSTFNIITIQVDDSDLSPARRGVARMMEASGTTVMLEDYVVGGEREKTEKFDGGEDNPVCDADGDPTNDNVRADDAARATLAARAINDILTADERAAATAAIAACASQGAATVNDGSDAVSTSDDTYTFMLKGIARDIDVESSSSEDGVGVVAADDLVRVVVNGQRAVASDDADDVPDGTGPYYRVVVLDPGDADPGMATPGGGIQAVTIHRLAPQNAKDSVQITFKETEFAFDTSFTPIDTSSSSVRFDNDGISEDRRFFAAPGSVTIASASGSNIELNGAAPGHLVATFYYDVKDNKENLVTLNASSVGDRRLDTSETSPGSDEFETTVAIFNQTDSGKISDAAKPTADQDVDKVVSIQEMRAVLAALDSDLSTSLSTRVGTAAMALGFTAQSTTAAEDFVDRMIWGRDGDIITVTYADANPSTIVAKAAMVDLAAPTVTLVSPSDGFFTNTGTATLSAEVVDAEAGVLETDIRIVIDTESEGVIGLGTVQKSPIVDGYRVTMIPTGTIGEGPKKWFVGVEDKVGNVPAMDILDTGKGCDADGENCTGTGPAGVNEAPKGAGGTGVSTADNPFKFTVDTGSPTLTSGKTGLSLKNPGVTSGAAADKEKENKNKSDWVRVYFDLGAGGAPLDTATVGANDFRVDGAEPLDAKINSLAHEGGEIEKGSAVYLQVNKLDTSAQPKVELTGEIKDLAGNTRTEGTIAKINDGLSPVLTVTPSTELAKDTVTITVSSTEDLRINPQVTVVASTEPAKVMSKVMAFDAFTGDAPTVSLQTGSLTTWQATFKKSGQAERYYVVVKGEDRAGNFDVVGDATNDEDIISFQLDAKAPSLKFKDAADKDLEDSKQTEGAVWLVAEFDEDEHADDKSRKVTVTALTLTDTKSEEVVTEDVTLVFGGEVECADHNPSADADPVPQNMCAERTVAVNLMPGMYNVKVTGVDAVGNETTGNVDFEVIEAEPFEVPLRPGQNFISIPGMPMGDGGNIDTLLADEAISSISTYDRSRELQGENPWLRSSKDLETGMFSGDITAIEPGKAYFISSTASVTVEIRLQAAGDLPPIIPVRQGYNAIGFWSVSGDTEAEIDLYLGSIGWSVAYSYDPTPGKGWEVLRKGGTDENFEGLKIEAGKGYLVYALYDAVLTP